MSELTRPATSAPERATDAEAITTKERSQLQLVLGRFFRHKLAVGSLVLFLLIVAFAFIGPELWKHRLAALTGEEVNQVHIIYRSIPGNQSPSWDHPFGTTRAGHDYMGQIMRGTQQTLKVGLLVALMSTVIGSVWGAVAGFYRGKIDGIMMRFVDVIFVVPLLVVVLVLAGMTRGTTWLHVAVILGAFIWINTARVIRGLVLSLREQEFVEAARAMGASDARIIGRHLLPNTVGVIIVDATLVIAVAVLVEAALSFLGFGITMPDTSLGLLINQAQDAVFTRPWLFYFPGVFIIMICLSINFIGDGLRDALDPKQTMVRR